jgi:hypothetical protein
MKPWIPGAACAIAVIALFPSDRSLSDRWTKAVATMDPVGTTADSSMSLDAELIAEHAVAPRDTNTLPADPFGLPPEPVAQTTRPAEALGPALPPPPRIWKATGRVGERAALLSSPDGRILVVKDGMVVDSAKVVSIGNGGVTLEDRAGRFVLQLP